MHARICETNIHEWLTFMAQSNSSGKHLLLFLVVFSVCFAVFYKLLKPQPEKGITLVKPITERPALDATHKFNRISINVPIENPTHRISYYLYEPEKTKEKLPLVVVLHGSPGKAYAAQILTEEPYKSEYPAYVMAPMAPRGQPWSHTKSMFNLLPENLPLVVAALPDLLKTHNIDKNRIYVVGCSLGGDGAFGASEYFSDAFAAGVAISGGWETSHADKMTKMPLFIMAGKNDTVVSVEETGAMVTALKKAGAPVRYKEFDMGHNCPSPLLYKNFLWNWLFKQILH